VGRQEENTLTAARFLQSPQPSPNKTEGIMLKIDLQKQLFTRLETPSLADASISERYDLQEYIYNSPETE
jgi:hypothetical protein